MSDWYEGIKSTAKEMAGGGQGVIIRSQLTPEELEAFRKNNPKPTGEAAKKPFIRKGQY